jgi:nucleotide-binding universal stress UspA family protein
LISKRFKYLRAKCMLRKILVAISNPELEHYVFDHALMLAEAMNARLGLLHVTDPDEAKEEPPSYLDDLDPYLSNEESDPCCYVGHFETFEPDLFGDFVGKATAKGVSSDCIHCFGDPERSISDFAEAWTADLIVMGRRGRTGIAELFLGSVSNYTVHKAPCSVYVVHPSSAANLKTS